MAPHSSRIALKVQGLDCGEEVRILRDALAPHTSQESLHFDVMRGRLVVEQEAGRPTLKNIQSAIRKTGMTSVLWEDHLAKAGSPHGRSWRNVMVLLSAVFIVLGYALHAAESGWRDALTAGETAGFAYPWYVAALYAAALALSWSLLAPKAWAALRNLRPDMHLLMSIAVVGAIVLGNWLEAAMVAVLFATALMLEAWSVGRANRAITALMDLAPDTARRIDPADKSEATVPVESVTRDERVRVLPGERIPLDGEITEGDTSVNQAPITGESVPVQKSPGDPVYAGSINNEGSFVFRVTNASGSTSLARIIRMVEEARERRAPMEQWVDSFARVYTPLMIGIAVGIAVIPALAGWWTWRESIYQALVMLLIACPCALVISTPVSIVAGVAAAARAGVLIKGGVFLEACARLRAVAFDKTGTLTLGEPAVKSVKTVDELSEADALGVAAALEAHSTHPLAVAIQAEARRRGIDVVPGTQHTALAGKGVRGTVEGASYWIGSERMAAEMNADVDRIAEQISRLEDSGETVVILGRDATPVALIGLSDTLRPESRDAVAALGREGISHLAMLTGDNRRTAVAIAESAGINEVHAALLPEDKVDRIRRYRSEAGTIAMIGDGINDAPAMAAADVGFAMGAIGSDTALESADIALMADDLTRLPWLVRHAHRTLRIIRENIVIALGLKVVVFVLALLGWATLWLAILADMGASLVVIANALRLLKTE